jgi:hypothetical protein
MESAVLEFVRKAAPTTVQSANAPSPRPALAVPQHYSPVDVKPTPQLAASDAPRPSKPPVPPGPEPVLPRSPATESPSHDHQGHAEDYHWIRGTVSKWRNEWRLRYAAVDQVDPYGGSLPLVGDEHLSQLKDNGCYLLQGYVVLHDSRLGGPAFYVEAVKN